MAGADDEAGQLDSTRRKFIVGGGAATLGVVACAYAVPAAAYLLHPLRNKTVSGGGDLVKLGKRGQFRPGEPTRIELHADRVDAWSRSEHVRIGAVWVIDRGGELTAFSTVCPHLGCAIEWSADSSKFRCPCHNSAFALDGTVEGGPCPRSLDTLALQEQDGELFVRYERFRLNVPSKEPLG